MRERVRTDTVYNFEELTEDAQQKALERLAEGNNECYEPSELTSQFELQLAEWGFPTDKVEWSLGWSQGDGVAFYGTIDLDAYLRKTKQRTKFRSLLGNPYDHVGAWISRNSWGNHYSHSRTMDVSIEVDKYSGESLTPKQEALEALLLEALQDHVVDMSRTLERYGYNEIESIGSREYIVEQIEANEYEFTVDGRLI